MLENLIEAALVFLACYLAGVILQDVLCWLTHESAEYDDLHPD